MQRSGGTDETKTEQSTSTKIEWFKPVFAGDVLKGKAGISNITRRNACNGAAEMTIDIVNQERQPVMAGTVEPVVKYGA